MSLNIAPLLSSKTWHAALSHPDGRDKIFRLVQFALRLVRGAAAGRTPPNKLPAHLARLAALEATLASARQLWRLFKWTGFYSTASLPPVSTLPTVLPSAAALATLQDACLAGYFLLDNLSFLSKTSVIPGLAPPPFFARRAGKLWAAANLLGLLRSVARLRVLSKAAARATKRGSADAGYDAGSVRAAMAGMRREAFVAAAHAGDAVVAFSMATEGRAAHPALVGACGVVSSLVGVWRIWPATE
jgi:Peroxisomal biogenesis factor 11 (PEX11)